MHHTTKKHTRSSQTHQVLSRTSSITSKHKFLANNQYHSQYLNIIDPFPLLASKIPKFITFIHPKNALNNQFCPLANALQKLQQKKRQSFKSENLWYKLLHKFYYSMLFLHHQHRKKGVWDDKTMTRKKILSVYFLNKRCVMYVTLSACYFSVCYSYI